MDHRAGRAPADGAVGRVSGDGPALGIAADNFNAIATGLDQLVQALPVGTPAQVAEALLKYYDLGVTRFLIRGFDPLNDVREWGEELIPLLREGARLRDEARAAA